MTPLAPPPNPFRKTSIRDLHEFEYDCALENTRELVREMEGKLDPMTLLPWDTETIASMAVALCWHPNPDNIRG